MINQEQYNLHFQSIRELFIRISLLNTNLTKIDEIQGVVTGGSISVSENSAVRRTCDLDLIIKDSSFLIGEDKKIWIDKRFNLEIGIKSIITDEILWFNMGHYCINSPSISYNATTKNLKLQGLDFMCLLDGTLGGNLETITIIDEDTPISQAILSIADILGNVKKLNIENADRDIPFRIEKQAGDTVFSLLEEIKDLYMDWELFFDIDGVLTFRKIKNRVNDPVVLDFADMNRDLIEDYSYNINFENVKNRIIVHGKMLDNGFQAIYTLNNEDVNSIFNQSKIGVIPLVISDENIFNLEQAETRAEYEYWKHNNLNESVNISCLPIYFLRPNLLVNFNLEDIGLSGKYIVTDITIPLDISGRMSFSGYKVY